MASTTAFAGKKIQRQDQDRAEMSQLRDSIHRLSGWLEKSDYRGYDTFDGLNAKFVRPLTFESKFLRTCCYRECGASHSIPSAIGNSEKHSTKGMGFWLGFYSSSRVYWRPGVGR